MLKKALTSAKAGDKPVPATLQDDTFTFPCLSGAHAAVPASEVDSLSQGLERFDITKGASLPSSAKVGSLLSDGRLAADYDLDPYRRRAGKERFPMSFENAELASSAKQNFLSDAVIGSLPKGLSLQERSDILRNTPLSPTLNLLSSMPSDKVASRSLDGKKLRRHVLRGAVMVFVTAGYSGKKFVFEKAKELGVRSIIIDGPDSWSQTLVDEGIAEKFYGLDFSDADTVFERCVEVIEKARNELGELDGILSFCEIAQPLVARLTEKFALPGNSPSAVDAARDKFATRQCMMAAGLPTPKNYLITEEAHLEEAAAHVGFPAVIKPIFGAASIGVQRVDNLANLKTAFKSVIKELRSAKIVAGALQQGDDEDEDEVDIEPSGDSRSASSWIKLQVMMEEYLDGPEVDVDVIMSEGMAVYGAVSDNWPTIEPYFNETGSNAPSILPKDQQKELLDLSVKSVQALGFNMGVFHVECKQTSRGPRLIEVNCRMGGGPVRNINLLVWGVDMVEEQLLLNAGIPSRPPVAPAPLMCIAEYSLNAPISGVIQHTDYLKDWQDHPEVLYARPLVEAGGKVTGPSDGMPTWVAEIMVTKSTVEEAIEFMNEIESKLTFPIVPRAKSQKS